MSDCPINLDCSMMLQDLWERCESQHLCNHFAEPWELPYEYNSYENVLTVNLYVDWPEQQLEELKDAGYAMAWTVPYDYYPDGLGENKFPILEVHLNHNCSISKEMRKDGWERAKSLPYHYADGLIVHLNERELGFEIADKLPYKFIDGAMVVVDPYYQIFAPSKPLPYEIRKDGLYVTRSEVNRHYYDNFFSSRISCHKLYGFEYIWMKPKPLQYSYKFSKEHQCNLLRVNRAENGFARAWYLKDRDRHFHKGLPVLTDHYPRPKNWKFKKELAELGLQLRENQKPIAYFSTHGHRIKLWAVEDCDRSS
jgi:hypothetical protein